MKSPVFSLLASSLLLLTPLHSLAQQTETEPPTRIFGDKTEITVGLGAAVAPRYLGAKDNSDTLRRIEPDDAKPADNRSGGLSFPARFGPAQRPLDVEPTPAKAITPSYRLPISA